MANIIIHAHSQASRDCLTPLTAIYRRLEILAIDALCLTDHDTIASVAIYPRVKIIRSEEITTSQGEIIGIFLTQAIPAGLSLKQTLAAIHSQGGLAIAPHPFDRLRTRRLPQPALDTSIDEIDIIEIFNARTVFQSDNGLARDYARAHNKPGIYGSDAHTLIEYGDTWLEGIDCSSPSRFLASLPTMTVHAHRAPLWVHGATKYVKWTKQSHN